MLSTLCILKLFTPLFFCCDLLLSSRHTSLQNTTCLLRLSPRINCTQNLHLTSGHLPAGALAGLRAMCFPDRKRKGCFSNRSTFSFRAVRLGSFFSSRAPCMFASNSPGGYVFQYARRCFSGWAADDICSSCYRAGSGDLGSGFEYFGNASRSGPGAPAGYRQSLYFYAGSPRRYIGIPNLFTTVEKVWFFVRHVPGICRCTATFAPSLPPQAVALPLFLFTTVRTG